MLLVIGQDGKSIKQAKVSNLSKHLRSITAFVRIRTSFMDTMKALLHDGGASDL